MEKADAPCTGLIEYCDGEAKALLLEGMLHERDDDIAKLKVVLGERNAEIKKLKTFEALAKKELGAGFAAGYDSDEVHAPVQAPVRALIDLNGDLAGHTLLYGFTDNSCQNMIAQNLTWFLDRRRPPTRLWRRHAWPTKASGKSGAYESCPTRLCP